MAIFVSNSATPAFSPPLNEVTDPNLPGLETAFTEELAAVRRPLEADAEPAVSASALKDDEKEDDAVDLQILPVNVLINAVTDANFAYALQGQVAQPVVPLNVAVAPEVTIDLTATSQAVGAVGVAKAPDVLGALPPVTAHSESNVALPLAENGQTAKLENFASQAPIQSEIQTQVAASPGAAAAVLAKTALTSVPVPVPMPMQKAGKPEMPSKALALETTQATPTTQASQPLPADASKAVALDPAQLAAPLSSTSQPSPDLVSKAVNSVSSEAMTSVKVLAASSVNVGNATEIAQANAQSNVHSNAQSNIPASLDAPTLIAQPILSRTNLQASASPSAMASSVQAAVPLVAASSTASNESAEAPDAMDAAPEDSSSSVFDAQLGARGTGSVSETSVAKASILKEALLQVASNTAQPSFETVQVQSKIDLVSSLSIQDQNEPSSSALQSFEELSSSFVSSLVGGAPRPMATVMDMTALQSQDKSTPVTPHEARLDAGSIHTEIQRMVKQGGGHVVMEITPPDQSKFTIELKMDNQGNARLIVEGVSDSTRTRLEQSAPQLREQFQQMGMELQLDMRQQRDTGSQSAQNQESQSERDSWMAQQPDIKLPEQRASAASRALASGANQVYLYA